MFCFLNIIAFVTVFVSWQVCMTMRIPEAGPLDPVPPLELPHAFKRVSESNELNKVVKLIQVCCHLCSNWIHIFLF